MLHPLVIVKTSKFSPLCLNVQLPLYSSPAVMIVGKSIVASLAIPMHIKLVVHVVYLWSNIVTCTKQSQNAPSETQYSAVLHSSS